jgi:CheY-like chemotaxis protein
MAYILVVDDDSETRIAVRALLEVAGHEVAEAREGVAGLSAIGARVPDLIITELFMDGMEGIEFLCTVLQMWPSEPVLVMSSPDRWSRSCFSDMVQALGAAGRLDKPIVQGQLFEVMDSVLPAFTRDYSKNYSGQGA